MQLLYRILCTYCIGLYAAVVQNFTAVLYNRTAVTIYNRTAVLYNRTAVVQNFAVIVQNLVQLLYRTFFSYCTEISFSECQMNLLERFPKTS